MFISHYGSVIVWLQITLYMYYICHAKVHFRHDFLVAGIT